jgi:hypothetical protein
MRSTIFLTRREFGNGDLLRSAQEGESDMRKATSILCILATGGLAFGDTALDQARSTYQRLLSSEEQRHSNVMTQLTGQMAQAYDAAIKRARAAQDLPTANKMKAELDQLRSPTDAAPAIADDQTGTPSGVQILESKSLTKLKPVTSQAGWDQVRMNREPAGKQPLVKGKLCDEFIFAHANSMVRFRVPSGYNYFTATGGNFMGGLSHNFSLVADGKTIYESAKSQSAQTSPNFVDIAVRLPEKAKTLDLIIEGPGVPTFWAYPRLHRAKFD